MEVIHDQPRQRFVVALEGKEAELQYRLHGNSMDMFHTYVPPEFRGQHIAEKLSKAAFEFAKDKSMGVIPSCPYISMTYLKRHPEYLPLTHI